ncbi:UDP-glucuronic acid decarboxylase 1, partial [Tanacetum coccineum]
VGSCYDEGKRTAETLTMDYHRGAGVEHGYCYWALVPVWEHHGNGYAMDTPLKRFPYNGNVSYAVSWPYLIRIWDSKGCYDEGKRTAETLTMDYHRGAGVEVQIARIFNTYGPRMYIDDGRVVSNFVAHALRKEPMTIYGDGKQTRSFQYVSDLVSPSGGFNAVDRSEAKLEQASQCGQVQVFLL